ncbi:MAG: hypothetical protein AAGI23_21325 [Bacteroidota bacterium]
MNEDQRVAQAQLDLINEVISNTKARLEQNGGTFLFWGILLTVASAAQFVLIQMEYYSISYYPYFAALFGWIYTIRKYAVGRKTKTRKSNILGKAVQSIWIHVGINAALLGFLLAIELGDHLIPVILLVVSAGVLLSGVIIKHRYIFFAGIFCNLAAYLAFFIPYGFQPLLTSIVYFAVMVVPGYLLIKDYRRRHGTK